MEETNAFAVILYGPDCELTPHGPSSVHIARSPEELETKVNAGWTRYPPGGAPLTIHPFTDPVPDSELVDALGDAMSKRMEELPEEPQIPDGSPEPGPEVKHDSARAEQHHNKKKGR